MEADSTTLDNSSKDGYPEATLPFTPLPNNILVFKKLTNNSNDQSLERQIVERLQVFGLLPKQMKCPSGHPDCKIVKKAARVIDKVQWACEGCGKRLPIRTRSFFMRIQCSILQTLQIILAWSEDAECETAAQHFDVKQKVAHMIYDRLDKLAIKEQDKVRLGGEGSVVLTEMYPDCLTRLSPDTTDHPHVRRVLMVADTKHVPTRYHLHVIKDDLKRNSSNSRESLETEIEAVLSEKTRAGSILVTGSNVPHIEGASSLQQLAQHCDSDMQHFLYSRIWRQALSLCAAGRGVCAGAACAGPALCASALHSYLQAALYRHAHSDNYYQHILTLLAREYTEQFVEVNE